MNISKTRSGEAAEVSYPVTLRIYDDATDEIFGDPIVITSKSYVFKSPILSRS